MGCTNERKCMERMIDAREKKSGSNLDLQKKI